MKSFAQLILLAFAILGVVNAKPVADVTPDNDNDNDDISKCKVCKPSECDFDSYSDQVKLDKIKYPKSVITTASIEYQTPPKGKNNRPDIYANFFWIGDHHSPPPAGTITSISDKETALKIDFQQEGYPKESNKNTTLILLIEPDSTCTTGLPDTFLPGDIKKIVAGTMPDDDEN